MRSLPLIASVPLLLSAATALSQDAPDWSSQYVRTMPSIVTVHTDKDTGGWQGMDSINQTSMTIARQSMPCAKRKNHERIGHS